MVAKTRITAPIYYHLVYQVLTATIKPLPKKVPHACVQYIIMAMGMPKRFIINFFVYVFILDLWSGWNLVIEHQSKKQQNKKCIIRTQHAVGINS